MRKALGVLFVFLACGQLIPIYAVVRALLEARSVEADSGTTTMSGLLGLSVGVPLLLVFSAVAIWCFQKRR